MGRWGTPPLALVCITWFGWRWAFVCFALLGAVWCAIFLLWFKDDPAQHPRVNAEELKLLEASRELTTHRVGQRHLLALLLTRRVLVLGLQYFCFSYVWYFYITWLPTYLREGRGQSPARAAALAVLPLLFGGFGSLATGLAHVRLPRRAIAFCGFLSTAGFLLAVTHIESVVPAMVAMGMASFASDLALPISWGRVCGDWRAVHGDGGSDDEYAGQPGGFYCAGGRRGDAGADDGNWNVMIDTMAAAAVVSALCWLYLDPEAARRERELALSGAAADAPLL